MVKSQMLIAGAAIFLLISCQPKIVSPGRQLAREPEAEIIRGTSRPNAIDRDSFDPERREGLYYEWVGGARTASWREGLRLRYNVDGTIIQGEYALGSVGVLNYGFLGFGTITGAINNGVLEAVLYMDGGCEYTVFGSVTRTTIRAYANPTNCPNAEQQEWELGKS